MAALLYPAACMHPIGSSGGGGRKPSLSCTSKVFARLKPQSAGVFGDGKPNVNADFHRQVLKSLTMGLTANKRATGACVYMMSLGVPRVLHRTPGERTWQWTTLWSAFQMERVIFVGRHIDEQFSNLMLATMLFLDHTNPSETIYLCINGLGGDITPTMTLYDTMRSLKSPLGTRCFGSAYDMGAFLLAAGDKGNRACSGHSRIALQSPAGTARGQADDIRNEANELLRIRDYLFTELSKQTGQPVEKIYQDLKGVKYFNSKAALEYGLIDHILHKQMY